MKTIVPAFIIVLYLSVAVASEPVSPPIGHGYLGVAVRPLASERVKKDPTIPKNTGLVVIFVTPGSPADKAGLKHDDLLLEMNGQKLVTPDQLGVLVGLRKVGDKAVFKTISAGTTKTVGAVLGVRPKAPVSAAMRQTARSEIVDLNAINRIYNDPKLTNEQKSKTINERLARKHFPNLRVVVKGKSISVVPKEPLAEKTPKADKGSVEGKVLQSGGITIEIIQGEKKPPTSHRTTVDPKDSPPSRK